MSKSRRTRRGTITYTANRPRLPGPLARSIAVALGLPDRRFYHPDGMRAPLAVTSRLSSRLVQRSYVPSRLLYRSSPSRVFSRSSNAVSARNVRSRRNLSLYSPSAVAFKAPSRVLLCVRRQQRKEVMHAYSFAGKSGQRSPRRNQWSHIRCR